MNRFWKFISYRLGFSQSRDYTGMEIELNEIILSTSNFDPWLVIEIAYTVYGMDMSINIYYFTIMRSPHLLPERKAS
jgi:hypothetical protein